MTGLGTLTLMLPSDLVPKSCVEAMMPKLAQQALEKIDRTRGHAARIFASLVLNESVPHVPKRSEVLNFFPDKLKKSKDLDDFGWAVESETFPIFTKLIRLHEYRERVLVGLVVSVGGVTERLVRQSSVSLFEEISRMKSAEMEEFGELILKVRK